MSVAFNLSFQLLQSDPVKTGLRSPSGLEKVTWGRSSSVTLNQLVRQRDLISTDPAWHSAGRPAPEAPQGRNGCQDVQSVPSRPGAYIKS